jgi:hypothetical protein
MQFNEILTKNLNCSFIFYKCHVIPLLFFVSIYSFHIHVVSFLFLSASSSLSSPLQALILYIYKYSLDMRWNKNKRCISYY